MEDKLIEIKLMELKNEFDGYFRRIIKELDEKGTEYSRSLKSELSSMKEKAKLEMDEIWSYVKSHLISIEHGQNILYDPKDGILTVILKKAEQAIKFAGESAECTAEAAHAARDAEAAAAKTELSSKAAADAADDVKRYSRASIFVTATTFVGIVITVLTLYLTIANRAKDELKNQETMIIALHDKLQQDSENQKQTVEIMEKLYKTLKQEDLK